MRHVCCAAALASMLCTAAPASGQEATVLTLEEALRIARSGNPEFLRTANDLEVANASLRSAWGSFLPSLNTSMSFSGSRSTTLTSEDFFGEPVESPEPVTSSRSSAGQGISTQITLFDGGASVRSLQAQRAAYNGVEAQIEAQAIQLDARVSREYFQAVRAVRNIALEEHLLASALDRLERTEQLLRLAARNREDVLGARSDVAQAELNLERARGELDKTRLILAATLGMDPTTSVSVDTVLPPVFDPAELDVQALVSGALSSSPLVRQRESALRAAKYRASAARGRRLPSISANAGYNRGMSSAGYGAFGQLNPDQNYGFSFGLGISLPLFSRFQTSEAIAQASASAVDAEYDLRAAQLTVERDVRAAIIDLDAAYRLLQLAEVQVDLNRERQELTQDSYRLGGVDFTALQNVIDRTAQAERQALEALFGFINARISLEEKLGHRLEG
ncbi:MAG TPA: TolC family protein [Longimicrobiales bacterium]|nr:TolC family protein [Longimicrobiales bacterium]